MRDRGGGRAMGIVVNGLASGLDTASIISQLIAISQQPIKLLQNQVGTLQLQQTALGALKSQLISLRGNATTLSTLSTFNARIVSSSNEAVLSATATSSASLGAFVFRVGRTASAAQSLSTGFADTDTTAVGGGTFSIEFGTRTTNAFIDPKTPLSFLNGQTGVSRGSIKVTDRAGNSSVIDLSVAETIQDVIDAINADDTVKVSAAVSGDRIVLTDQSGSTASNLKVEEVEGRDTARDLGILQNVASNTLTGDDVNTLATTSKLELLNSGLGVRNGSGTDFTISIDGGAGIAVSLASTVKTLQDVITAIQDAATSAGESLTVSLTSDKKGLRIVDNAGDGGSITVTDVSGAAADLGIAGTASGDTLTGTRLVAEYNTILTKVIGGGAGLSTVSGADFRVTLSDGNTFDVDLDASTHQSLQDVIDAIKAAHDAAFPATTSSFLVEVNGAGNGLRLKDSYGGTGNIAVMALNGSTAATALGIAKTGSGGTLEGNDVDRQFISAAMRLSDLNGGKGIFKGSFQVQDKEGKVFTVDISDASVVTVADLINTFNTAATAAGSSATLAVNSAGDGVVLSSPAGSGTLVVTDLSGGRTAKDLNLASTGTSASSIDGSYEIQVTVDADDTLDDVVTKINNLGKDVVASIINDGSAGNPYRLIVTATGTGEAGAIVVDRKTSALAFEKTIQARNAAVLVGDTTGGSSPLLVTHADNTIENILTGLTLNVKSASASSVTITVANDDDNLANQMSGFVGAFNAAVTQIRQETAYDVDTQQAGILLGNPTVRMIEDRLFRILRTVVPGLTAPLNRIQPLGVSVDDETGLLVFDKDDFLAQLSADRAGVEKLLRTGADITASTALADLGGGAGIRQVPGFDFEVRTRDGAVFKVNLDGADTIQAVITAINTASGNNGRVAASLSSDGSGITLTDTSSGSNNLEVADINGSFAAFDLGISGTAVTASGSSSTVFKGASLKVNGLMAIIDRDLDLLTRTEDGVLTDADEVIQEKVDDLEDQIESLQARIDKEEEQLQKEFAALELALAEFQATSSFLTQQFAALSAARAASGKSGGLSLFG